MRATSSQSIRVQRSDERFYGDHGWLKTNHSFSPDYSDPNSMHWGALHVFNEDLVAAGEGFPPHPHRDMEIITYVLSGSLEHRDSIGNHGIVEPGGVQYMSAGTGVVHSEFNASTTEPLRFLQMWLPPRHENLKPVYGQRNYSLADRRNRWLTIASGIDSQRGDVALDRDAAFVVSRLEANVLERTLDESRLAFLFVADGELDATITLPSNSVNVQLAAGDAVRIAGSTHVAVRGSAEIAFWDVPEMPSIW